MSTSTISRAEDTQRMKELEDTFEERYMKVRDQEFFNIYYRYIYFFLEEKEYCMLSFVKTEIILLQKSLVSNLS